MKSSQAVAFCLQYQKENSQPSTVKHYEFMLSRFLAAFRDRELHSIKSDETLAFLTKVTAGNKTATKRNRYGTLKAFFNLIITFFNISSSGHQFVKDDCKRFNPTNAVNKNQ